MKQIKCTRCEKIKSVDEYYFCKKRNKYQTPCKSCRNLQKRIRRLEKKRNGKFCRSELDNQYRLKGLPTYLRESIIANILINREIETRQSVQFCVSENISYVYCPICFEYEVIELPIKADDIINILSLFKKRHEHCRNK